MDAKQRSPLHRRIACALGALSALASLAAHAQPASTYPSKPIHTIVTMQAGPLDAFARIMTERLSARMKQPFVVDARPGAGGNIAAGVAAKLAADGHAVLLSNDTTFTVNPALFGKLPFDPERDFIPVSVLGTFGQMAVVNPKLPINTIKELAAGYQDRPITFSSAGNGAPSHLSFAYLQTALGIQATHIPYKTNPQTVAAVLSGDVDATMVIASTVVPHVRAGKLRALAYSGKNRSILAPEVQTMAELGYPGFEIEFAFVLFAPAGTPREIVEILHREAAQFMKTPELADTFKTFDLSATALPPAESAQWLRNARGKWSKLVRDIKLKVD